MSKRKRWGNKKSKDEPETAHADDDDDNGLKFFVNDSDNPALDSLS